MAARFKRARKGPVTVTFSAHEAELLRALFAQLVDLLDSEDRTGEGSGDPEFDRMLGISGVSEPPADVALARLFPDGYNTDHPQASAEFRRYTEADLRARKHQAVRAALASLDPPGTAVTLDDERAQAWLGALNDVRLALGTRLGVTEDCDERFVALADDDQRRGAYEAYLWLGYLQETLVQALP